MQSTEIGDKQIQKQTIDGHKLSDVAKEGAMVLHLQVVCMNSHYRPKYLPADSILPHGIVAQCTARGAS